MQAMCMHSRVPCLALCVRLASGFTHCMLTSVCVRAAVRPVLRRCCPAQFLLRARVWLDHVAPHPFLLDSLPLSLQSK